MVKEKTIEEKYQKLSQKEHVLKRPNVYIGDIKKNNEELWVMGENGKMIKKFVEYSPGFMKIFDEVLSNATDHAIRDPTVTMIKVDYNKETGEISVYNNGTGVPVVLHKEQNIYVPELIFGHLLSGSNYDDNDSRIVVGVNGMGVKLCNIFSTKFKIETVDSENKKKFIQEYSNNMENKTNPKITTAANTKSYTKITFTPDYNRFSMTSLEDDTILLIVKRVYDCIANVKNIKLYLNGQQLKGKSFVDYIKYYFEDSKVIYESNIQTIKGNEFIWEYAIIPNDKFEQVSFVNGNCTNLGGKHLDYILYQIINKLKDQLESKKKLKDVKPGFIKDKMFIFLKSTIINPSFNSQTKETLTTQVKDFGCKVEVTDSFISKLYKSPIVDEIVEFCRLKESANLSKTTDGKKINKVYIPKLEDAIYAGTIKSNQCTLILTEGDSAKTFAMWGRGSISGGPEKYGIFSLKGKLLNIRDASISQLINNEEINNIKQIVGLKENKVYTDTKELRYGRIMLLTDADLDGSHIKSLVVNFIHNGWESLLKISPNFIQTLKTPIVKAIKGKDIKEFFTEQDYNLWVQNANIKNYKINYYKGLGTSTKDDAKQLFKRFDELVVNYYYKDNKCDESILLAFDKDKNNKIKKIKDTDTETSDIQVKCTDLRKAWLAKYDKNLYIDVKDNKVSYQDLINKELIHFSIYDNSRSIPSICDGLKPSQRKILYYMLKNNVCTSVKVAQLSGKISSDTSYHHGEASLEGAIVGLAQNFVGTNNINLLYPDGNFGSRYLLKDAASARYIKTRLSDVTNTIFNKLDTPLLKILKDDGVEIEPEWYLPIIPMILVNGCEGIGTGYSTNIPPYNPKDLINNILRILQDKEPLEMIPYYKNFNGELIKDTTKENSYLTKGKWEKLSDTQIKVTELPVGCWVTIYKEFLESFVVESKKDTINKKKFSLKSVENKTKDENSEICFLIEFKDAKDLDLLIKSNTLLKELKLSKSINTNNMHVFSESLILTKYNNPNDILLDWYDLRLEYYQKRKDFLVKKFTDELIILNNKIRFITEYIEKIIDINRKSKEFITNLLRERDYHQIEGNFDYLLNLTIYSFTEEKIEALNKQVQNKQAELDYIKNKSDKELWCVDLEELNKYL